MRRVECSSEIVCSSKCEILAEETTFRLALETDPQKIMVGGSFLVTAFALANDRARYPTTCQPTSPGAARIPNSHLRSFTSISLVYTVALFLAA